MTKSEPTSQTAALHSLVLPFLERVLSHVTCRKVLLRHMYALHLHSNRCICQIPTDALHSTFEPVQRCVKQHRVGAGYLKHVSN